ncbi:MAG: N-acetyl-gamma-glutamyl-phosphate reductase [Deltaproteobacteria bacterium]|jgi:N-acetyl-gamma-glutamyl-phosphate reductase|nr:N-acetyl-gamma-glutamyl-phosphate reductase [Deltaproteobacteria bacterium]
MRLGVIGATGYAGLELLRLLAFRSFDEVVLVTSRQEAGQKLVDFFPALKSLANYDDLVLSPPVDLEGKADIFLMAAQHGAAMSLAPSLLASGAKVIDLSADYRLRDPLEFEKWYGPHASPELLPTAVYGLPEIYGPQIKKANLVANPGCYPTSVILALAPIMRQGIFNPSEIIIVDAKSGVTGAGRTLQAGYLFTEVYDNFRGYKIVGHRHTPEMIQELSSLLAMKVKLSFTPHLAPINRGILSTIYLRLNVKIPLKDLYNQYEAFYQGCRFVRVRNQIPETANVRGTNFCDMALFYDEANDLFKIVSVIDNICRGAAGQAVVNLNLMTGRQEDCGLDYGPLRP